MRHLFIALMLAGLSHTASAQQSPIKVDPMEIPDTESKADSGSLQNVQALTKLMEEAGLKDVQLSEALVIQAKDRLDRPIMLLVDPATMLAVELKSPEDQTTESGTPRE